VVLVAFTRSIAELNAVTPVWCCRSYAAIIFARARSGEIVFIPLQPESSTAANERGMDAEVNRALELIRQTSPKLALGTITNIYERGIIDYLARFAFDQSNPRKLWNTVRNAAIDQLGIGVTKEQFDNESDVLFIFVVRSHFPELTALQIRRLYRSFEHAIAKRIW